MRLKVGLRTHAFLGVGALLFFPVALLFSHPLQRAICFAAAFTLGGAAFTLNGYLGVTHGKMHMKIGEVISRDSRGEKMFKMDLAVQFAAAALSFGVASLFLVRALK